VLATKTNQMAVLEQLKHHETDELNEWLELKEKKANQFLKVLVQFADENPSAIKDYCITTIPKEFSSLSIVYEALSEHSSDWNDFLLDEIMRVVRLAKNKKIKSIFLQVLSDINMETIYENDQTVYIRALDFLTSNLHLGNEKNFNIQLLDIVDWFLLELEDDELLLAFNNWAGPMLQLANHAKLAVKLKAREVLIDTEAETKLQPLSFMEKVKGGFH